MAGAGFYAIESRNIRFGRDGHWYSDDERIDHPRIAALFSRCLRAKPDGGFVLEMGEERAPVEVEDTPFVVTRVDGDPKSEFTVRLNDGSNERLEPATLRFGTDHALYCRVKGGDLEARFLRPAHYQLAEWIEPTDDGFSLRCGGALHRI